MNSDLPFASAVVHASLLVFTPLVSRPRPAGRPARSSAVWAWVGDARSFRLSLVSLAVRAPALESGTARPQGRLPLPILSARGPLRSSLAAPRLRSTRECS